MLWEPAVERKHSYCVFPFLQKDSSECIPYHGDLWVHEPVIVVTGPQDVAILQIVDSIIDVH